MSGAMDKGVVADSIAATQGLRSGRASDLALRTDLGTEGMKKGDLSKFIEEAVRRRIFNPTVQDIKSCNANAGTDELQAIVDRAVREVCSERPKA